MFQRLFPSLVLLLACATMPPVDAAALRFEQVDVGGASMRLPSGWQRQQDEYSLIAMESQAESSPVLALFALAAQPGGSTTPAQLADAVLAQMDLASQGFSLRLVEERNVGPALYRLHALQHGDRFGYLASYSHTDSSSGALIHMFFSALEQRFIELGGTVLPLVAFAGLDPALIEQVKAESSVAPGRAAVDAKSCKPGQGYEVCLAEQWFGPGGQYTTPNAGSISQGYVDACGNRHQNARTPAEQQQAEAWCLQALQTASQISRMGHETSMKILYNMDSGWCYRGESGCD